MDPRDPTPPIEADGAVDVTLIRWMLSLSPAERLAVLQGFVDSIAELTRESPATTLAILRRPLEESSK